MPQLMFPTFQSNSLSKNESEIIKSERNIASFTNSSNEQSMQKLFRRKGTFKHSKFHYESPEKKKNFYDVITNFYLVKKFISKLQMTTLRKPKFLGQFNFSLIGDASFNYFSHKTHQNDKLTTKIRENNYIMEILLYFDRIKTFHPFSKFILFWDFLHLIIFIWAFISIPIDLSFRMNDFYHNLYLPENIDYYFKILVELFYFLDFFVNLNLSFYEKENLIFERKKIIQRYVKSQIYIDIMAYCFLTHWMYVSSSVFNILIFGYFFRIIKIKQIFKDIEELLVVNENYYHIYSLLNLFIRVFVVSHLMACVWHLIGTKSETNWMNSNSKGDITKESWLIQYLYSFYFIIITINTVGYGDITPQNPSELIFCIFFVIIGCMMFAYTLNCMGNIFQALYKKERLLKEELYVINNFMRSKNVPQSFQLKIRKYLEHIWNEEDKLNLENSMKVFNKLSDRLKSQLLIETNGSIVKNIQLFSSNFSQKTLNGICQIMKEERHPPGEIIFRQAEFRNKDLFFIKKGVVELFTENELNDKNNPTILSKMKEGSCFGEISFFSEMARSTGARSLEYTTLIRFDQDEFKKLIEENDNDKEKFNLIKDRINLYQNFDDIFLKCYSCNQRNHLVINCPALHCIFYKDILLKKYNFTLNQTRKGFPRKLKKHTTTLKFVKNPSLIKINTLDDQEFNEDDSNSNSGVESPGLKLNQTSETLKSFFTNKNISEDNTKFRKSFTSANFSASINIIKEVDNDIKELKESLLLEKTPKVKSKEGYFYIFFKNYCIFLYK